tara:strand:+ start:1643 stop:2314 length:672 start_codon:yes stop_codon:yes gene_type:complete
MKLDIFKIKAIPRLFWSSPKPLTFKPPVISLIMLILGLILFGSGEALLISAGIGVSPWTVFAQGVSIHTSWSIGVSTAVISSIVLFLWVFLKQTPGLGTIFNVIIISVVLDLTTPHLPNFETLLINILMAATGVLITGFGGAIYLIANLGPGPRDGLMTGLQRITNYPIAAVRAGIEVTIVVLGALLGGVVGIGTLFFAFGIGPTLAVSILLLSRLFNRAKAM